jgi:hypothetical protein
MRCVAFAAQHRALERCARVGAMRERARGGVGLARASRMARLAREMARLAARSRAWEWWRKIVCVATRVFWRETCVGEGVMRECVTDGCVVGYLAQTLSRGFVGISTSAARRQGAFVVEAKQNKEARAKQVRLESSVMRCVRARAR